MDRHNELRSKLCVICCGLAIRVLPPSLVTVIIDFFIIGYSLENLSFPRGICETCRPKLFKLRKGDLNVIVPEVLDYSMMNGIRIPRHGTCLCSLCDLSLKRGQFGANSSRKRRRGNPNMLKNIDQESQSGNLIIFCGTCFTKVGRGINHQCNHSGRIINNRPAFL